MALLAGPLAAATSDREAPARWTNLPARALSGEDFAIEILSPLDPADTDGGMAKQSFDLRRSGDLPGLRTAVVRLFQLAGAQAAYEDAHAERYLPYAYDVSSKGKRRALEETLTLLDEMISAGEAAGSPRGFHLLELLHAVQNGFRYPVKQDYRLIPDVFPRLFMQLHRHQMVDAVGAPSAVPDPPSSSFWRSPTDLRAADLYAGFGRAARPRYDGAVCEYKGPKTGWGAHPGFDVECAGHKLKFKLGDERYGGPFNTRLFDALGYHTEPNDAVAHLRLRYDRRVLTQYNSRKLLAVQVKFLFIPLRTHTITDIEDPFVRIDSAVMRDGRRVDGAALKRNLLRDSAVTEGKPRPETVAANYNAAFERDIDYLIWEEGTVEPHSDDIQTIGAWDFDQLDHASRREVRALFVLAAWVDQFNLRWENTRLAYLKTPSGWSLIHLLSDVGSGLGLARDLRRSLNSEVDSMLWEVTERNTEGTVKFSGFASSMENTAFSSVTADDARWMLRRMALLSERQLLAALLATGMSAAEVRLALEKLVSRRKQLLLDFGLAGEFPELAARRVDRLLDFDPANSEELAQVSLEIPGGRVIPEVRGSRIRHGRLVTTH